MNPKLDKSTAFDKAAACMAGFGLACLTFLGAATILVPMTGSLATGFGVPDIIPMALIFVELFVLPVAAAIYGVSLVARAVASND